MTNRFTSLALAAAIAVAAVPASAQPGAAAPLTAEQAAGSGGGSAQGGTGRGAPAQPPRFVVPAPVDPKLGPQAFSVVLVVGEMGNAQAIDNVPPAARKALNDMRDFLPYKSYRLLDTQWTLCCGRETIYNRLRGLDGEEYELRLNASVSQAGNPPAPTVNVQQFWLSEAGGNPNELATLRQTVEQRRLKTSAPDEELRALEAELAAVSRRSSNRTVINTSFRMDVGETVVVGTSRIKGDKALIALLTAVPPKGGTAR
jgi:hypothetical protein